MSVTGTAPVNIESSSRVRVTGQAPVQVSDSNKFIVTGQAPVQVTDSNNPRERGLTPVSVGSSSLVYANLEPYSSADGSVHIPIEFSGLLDPIFPAPTPPVESVGLPDPTTAPTVIASNTANGRLLPGKYRYSYAAWQGNSSQSTAPSPSVEITLTTQNTVTLNYPETVGADGYQVYREQELNVQPAPEVVRTDGTTLTLNEVVYDHYGVPLRTKSLTSWGKHEAVLGGVNTGFDWYEGARPGVFPGPYPKTHRNGLHYTHHNIWGQVVPVAGGVGERRVRCHVADIHVWHLVDGVWIERVKPSEVGNFEGGYWTGSTFSKKTTITGWRNETEGHSFTLEPTTTTSGLANDQSIAHWYYSGFWPREQMVSGTQAVAIYAKMRLIPNAAGVDVSKAKFVGCFNGDLFEGAKVSLGSNGRNPAFSIGRHKKLTGTFKYFSMVTGTEANVRSYPAMPFLAV